MKVMKSTPGSSSGVVAADTYAQLMSGPNSISTTNDSGNFINGPLSISSGIDSIKVGGIFRFNPILGSGIPSTIITPVPVLLIDPPIRNLTSMAGIAAMMSSIL